MKKDKFFLTLLFCFNFLLSQAQIKIIDGETKNAISNAKLFSQKGEIIGFSNLNGLIDATKIDYVRTDSIEVYHPNFISRKVSWKDFTVNKDFYLEPAPIIDLGEVVITGRKSEYLVLRGYFVSYQLIDNIPQSFTDGIVEYHINLKKMKLEEEETLYSRVFKNLGFIEEYQRQKKSTPFNLGSNILPFNFKEEVLLSDWDKYKQEDNGQIKLKGNVVGRFTENGDLSNFTIEYHSPNNPKTISLFGIKSIISNHTIEEKFDSSSPQIENIRSLAKYYNSTITQKGVVVDYELIQDFYVIEKKFYSREKYKNLNISKNNYNNTVDSEIEFSSAIPMYIKEMLYRNLELVSSNKMEQ